MIILNEQIDIRRHTINLLYGWQILRRSLSGGVPTTLNASFWTADAILGTRFAFVRSL